nr:Cilia- and flagella-associated protein 44 [Polyrhizophydium stewartii]
MCQGKHGKKDAEQVQLEDDFFYNIESLHLQEEATNRHINPGSIHLYHSFGFASHRRNNLHFLDDHMLLSSIGNVLIFLNLKNNEQHYMMGLREGSIGAIAVHPQRTFFAVAEIFDAQPHIYVFEYPSLKLHRILREGAERGYSDLCFNSSGDKIASVAIDPDYMLTIWNWKQEKIVLRSKAFSQDVYRVAFSQDNDGILTTSGMGHIKFWRMSSTFTGLKLQGYLGKFGATELSDIAAFIQLPDGKVLSSTETGNMLLWDGGMIKCEIGVKGRRLCHQGRIEAILLVEGEVITAGEDGLVRIWDLETIDNADVTTTSQAAAGASAEGAAAASSSGIQSRVFEMEPIDEILIAKDVKIKTVVRYPDSSHDYLVQDQQGHLFKLDLNKRSSDKLLSFHAGSVVSIDASPMSHFTASLGSDGSLRVYDYTTKATLNSLKYSGGGSCMCFLPKSLDSSGNTVIAGFTDGVIRIVSFTPSGMILQNVFKPHRAAVSTLAVSDNGRLIVTGSEDKTIFLFQVTSKVPEGQVTAFSRSTAKITPLGFLTLPGPVAKVSISPDEELYRESYRDESNVRMFESEGKNVLGRRILIALKDGSLFSALVSPSETIDTSISFEISAVQMRLAQWKGQAQGSQDEKLPRTKSMIRKAQSIAIGPNSPITAILYLWDGFFLASFVNSDDEAEVRLSHVLMPGSSRFLLVHKTPIVDLRLSSSKAYLLAGAADGTSAVIKYNLHELTEQRWEKKHQTYLEYSNSFNDRIQFALEERAREIQNGGDVSLSDPLDVQGQFWLGHGHDILQGRVNMLSTSFDDAFLFTAGSDGGALVWRLGMQRIDLTRPPEVNLEEQSNQIGQPTDITESSTYTIQEAKIKSEKDREVEVAEGKKQVVRNYIQDLRAEFIKIVAENEKQQPARAIVRTQLNVDPHLRADIERDTTEKIATLHKEMAWISEKESIGPAKLRRKFMEPLQTERIEFKSFEHTEIKSKLEMRKQLRAERAAVWKELMDAKPDEKYEDPKDIAAIRYAQLHMGDYKLKTADNYIVPESERIDADKKKRQIILLRESINALKEQYNKQVLKLRAKKVALVEAFAKDNKRIDGINAELAKLGEVIDTSKPVYSIEVSCEWRLDIVIARIGSNPRFCAKPEAFPDNRDKVSPADIAQLQKEEQEAAAHRSGNDDLMGAFGGGSSVPAASVPPATAAAGGATAAPQKAGAAGPGAGPGVQGKTGVALDSTGAAITAVSSQEADQANQAASLTPLDLEEMHISKIKLEYEKHEIKKMIDKSVKLFDAAMEKLAHDRVVLEGDLKFADIKLLLFYQEWVLLKEFEKYDTALAEKLSTKKAEKAEIDLKIAECQEKLAVKKSEIESVILKERQIQEEFQRLLGENNKNEEYLTKVFKRKIKRSKAEQKKVKEGAGSKGDGQEGEEEEQEDSDEDDMDSSFDSDMEEEEEEFEERCPADCDQTLWTRILDQRDQRLDQEELLADIQKAALKKENDSLIKKEKIIGVSLKNAETEIQDFQTQKQRKLNELDVVVPLRFHQIQLLERNSIPSDLSSALVFINEGLFKLRSRIRELQQEKADIKKQHKELRKQHVSFIKSKKEKQQKLQELSDRARDVQMLKFGQTIDLEKLERLGVNKTADELREKLQREDNKRLKEATEFDGEIESLKERLTNVTRDNTLKLETLVQLKEQRSELEDSLNASQASVTAEYSGPQKKEVIERDRLIALVQSQSQQIEALKHEIEMLIRKPMGQAPAVRSKSTVPHAPGGAAQGEAGGLPEIQVPLTSMVSDEQAAVAEGGVAAAVE